MKEAKLNLVLADIQTINFSYIRYVWTLNKFF